MYAKTSNNKDCKDSHLTTRLQILSQELAHKRGVPENFENPKQTKQLN